MAFLEILGVSKRFGNTIALDNVTLHIDKGELFAILGPSGCGKTTLLRIVAGLEVPDTGRIVVNGVDITFEEPQNRKAVMVFQNWALWPHMTVFDNIAYGLKIKGMPKDEIAKRVKWALELVKLEGLEKRYPHQLSGGQQQRVALARAIVVEPEILLLDEPLSNLDARLRIDMREELRNLIKKLGITAIYVTHDQEEAMAIADRMAVMNKGKVMQIGTPTEIYNNPKNVFVATFIGRANVIKGIATRIGDRYIEARIGGKFIKAVKVTDEEIRQGDSVDIVIRPHHISTKCSNKIENKFTGRVIEVSFLGNTIEVKVETDIGILTALLPESNIIENKDVVEICFNNDKALVFRSE
ncbi:MAG: ABC transporter ATP-binding protein [Ignisphaera sp.]